MTARALWTRMASLSAAAAAVLLSSLDPATVALLPDAGSAGVLLAVAAAGALLIALAGLRLPVSPATAVVLVLVAGVEEILWRGFALGEASRYVGTAPALVATSIAFGATHRSAWRQHVVTGAVFGAVFVATGSLLAAWCCHATYNLGLVAAARRGAAGT